MPIKETAYYNPEYKEICTGPYRLIFKNWEDINEGIRHQLEILYLIRCACYTIRRWLPLDWETKDVDSETLFETGLDYFFDMPTNHWIKYEIREFVENNDDIKYYKLIYKMDKYGWYIKTKKEFKGHLIYYKIRRVIIRKP